MRNASGGTGKPAPVDAQCIVRDSSGVPDITADTLAPQGLLRPRDVDAAHASRAGAIHQDHDQPNVTECRKILQIDTEKIAAIC